MPDQPERADGELAALVADDRLRPSGEAEDDFLGAVGVHPVCSPGSSSKLTTAVLAAPSTLEIGKPKRIRRLSSVSDVTWRRSRSDSCTASISAGSPLLENVRGDAAVMLLVAEMPTRWYCIAKPNTL